MASKHFPIDTPPEEILKAMEQKCAFTMDVSITNILHGTPEERARADAARIAKKLENKSRF